MAKYDVPAIYKQVDPCPVCGTPRVGIDQDDYYGVVPGVIEGTCTCDVCNTRYTLEHGQALFAPDPKDVNCWKCGHTIHVAVQKSYGLAEVSHQCDHRERFKALPGCPKCRDLPPYNS